MRAAQIDRQHGGMWLWLLQRVSAVILLVSLITHLVATHLLSIGKLSFDNVAQRLASAFFISMDILLLAAAIFHALNGTRMVLLDYWFAERRSRRILDAVLTVFGVAAFGYGLWALWPWIST
jgi:succinate dehydrogenase / fumarate reductase, cytochrome b subunit